MQSHSIRIQLKTLLLCLVIPLAAGGLSAYFVRNDFRLYEMLERPAFAPPAVVFPIVWTILYLLMGVASYLIFTADCPERTRANAIYLYCLQLGINVLWPLLFFKLGALEFAFIWIILLATAVTLTVIFFFRCSKPAGILLLPYWLWTLFALILSAEILKQN